MKSTELKDGMILVDKNGNNILFLHGEFFKEIDCCGHSRYIYCEGYTLEGVVEVYYSGELVWVRKNYVSFEEALRSGKRITYYLWKEKYFEINEIIDTLSVLGKVSRDSIMRTKRWIIEE